MIHSNIFFDKFHCYVDLNFQNLISHILKDDIFINLLRKNAISTLYLISIYLSIYQSFYQYTIYKYISNIHKNVISTLLPK